MEARAAQSLLRLAHAFAFWSDSGRCPYPKDLGKRDRDEHGGFDSDYEYLSEVKGRHLALDGTTFHGINTKHVTKG